MLDANMADLPIHPHAVLDAAHMGDIRVQP